MTTQTYDNFIPVYDIIPDEWKEGRIDIHERTIELSDGINARTLGFYLDDEIDTGNQFIPASGNTENRSVYRKVIDCGTLPNTTTTSVAHNISVNSDFTLIKAYGAATDPTGLTSLPLPFASPTASEQIKIDIDATNVNITTAMNYSSYTRTFIILEYLQEV